MIKPTSLKIPSYVKFARAEMAESPLFAAGERLSLFGNRGLTYHPQPQLRKLSKLINVNAISAAKKYFHAPRLASNSRLRSVCVADPISRFIVIFLSPAVPGS
jgi:hypothetical protein